MAKRSDSAAKKRRPGLTFEPDDPEQSARFIEFAEQNQTEDAEKKFEDAMKRIASYKPNRQAKAKAKSSAK